jgi:amino acid adenylation domain-containing protein
MIESKDLSLRENAVTQDAYVYPASFAQQRLWFLHQMLPDSPLYNVAHVVYIPTSLDVEALERSIQEIVRRHESLRTTFAAVSGVPMQVIVDDVTIPLAVLDLTHLPSSEARHEEAQRLTDEEAGRAFDLVHGPLLRIKLLRLGEETYWLLLNMHHSICDGWSMSILLRELAALYTAFTQGRPSPLSDLLIQYVDFSAWQQEWLQGERHDQLVSYWKQHLEGLAPLELPTDHPRPPFFNYRGKRLAFNVSAPLTQALHTLSQQEHATLFMTVLAAFQVLLARYAGQDDIAVGSPIANRTRTELEDLIGFFANTLVLRADLAGHPSFQTVLQRVRETLLDAYAHQDLPFEHLVEELRIPRDLSRNPLFQVMFVFQNTPPLTLQLPGLTAEIGETYLDTAKFDLSLSLTEHNGRLEGFLEYNSDLFERATIERLQGHFLTLLQSIITNPSQPIADLPLLPVEEQDYLLRELNPPFAQDLSPHCLHQLVEDQARRTPEAVALVCGEKALTYRELDQRANGVAAQLRARGVGADVLVGICAARSLELVVGLLGVLKAGGAYVPLDPTYPEERLSFILSDTQSPVLLAQRAMHERVATYEGTILWLDEIAGKEAEMESTATPAEVLPANLAYIIYTSGSTGRPKGVAITHASAAVLVAWAQKTYTSGELQGVLASTSICFDLSIFELFVPLSIGGTSILVDHALQLASYTGNVPVTLVNTVPSAARELLRREGFPPTVQTINLAGEALSLQLVQDLYEQTTAQRIFNLYGPSEDTTYSTGALIPPASTEAPSIGRPIERTRAYLLDQRMALVPLGQSGELYIGGDGLARGYLNRPDLTAGRFVPDPFSGQPGARLYRTGDLARYQPDGSLAFLGRIDHQVKVRGFRVELEEIETLLNQSAGVQENVVILREDVPGDQRLVAYLVTEENRRPTIGELRALVQAHLPEYMHPAHYVFLDALPLTLNRKLDRKRLPAPVQSRLQEENTFVAPGTPMEQDLATIWCEVLRVERIGVLDNFFELGGHSLLVTQIISRLRTRFGIDLPVRLFFGNVTIRQLASEIDQIRANSTGVTTSTIKRANRVTRQRINVQV